MMLKLLLAAGLSFGIVAFLLLVCYEALAFATKSPTITDYVRSWGRAHPFAWTLVVLILAVTLGHLIWR